MRPMYWQYLSVVDKFVWVGSEEGYRAVKI